MPNENQKDLVLTPNEYGYVLDETKGNVTVWVGPSKTSLSQSDKLVRFDTKSKKFVECSYNDAKQLFTSVPEGWYAVLKNPTTNGQHPTQGASNNMPEMNIGRKININGPANFALYPGQMATIVRGHTLRSNQYLVARVYDADSLNQSKEDRGDDSDREDYVNGQILIIKGTEISFYIPPTGIEIKAIDNNPQKGYVRDAITLERLEYCILKDEDGNKRYVHGPEVVFPEATETFIQDGNGNIKRNAIELSDISGVYVKVIADYTDECGKEHKSGEELFITGKDQMIYYPRPEHTFITYNGRVMHHAIAIPKGEGRYIMNRMTGDIQTVRGPAMYLPDPRTEVAVKRTLTRSQCNLWYPGNAEVLAANGYTDVKGANGLSDALFATDTVGTFADSTMYSAVNASYVGTPTKRESNKLSRTNTFTPPRTISLNSSKYEGAVAVDVWTGYAVNVISKDGSRQVVCGPQTILLDYDQTLETLELSTGKPKTTDNLEHIVFLRHENNRVSDIINVETSDFVKAQIKVSYLVNFDMNMQDKWFSVDNYVKHLCDWARAAVKRTVKGFSITELCDSCSEILLTALMDADHEAGCLHKFHENGMMISDAEMLSLMVDKNIQRLIDDHQEAIVEKALQLNAAQASAETDKKIRALAAEKEKMTQEYRRMIEDEKALTEARLFAIDVEKQKAKDAEEMRMQQARADLQTLIDSIAAAGLARKKRDQQAEIEYKIALDKIRAEAENRAAENMKKVLEAVGPELAAALNSENNQDTVRAIAAAVAPYAVANGDSVADAVNTMLRGTTLESIAKSMKDCNCK